MFAAEEIPDAAYWVRQIAEPDLDFIAIDSLPGGRNRVILQLGEGTTKIPAPGHAAGNTSATWVSSLAAGVASERHLLESLAQLYVRGAVIDWKAVDRGHVRQLIPLPGYPWHRRRYWFPIASAPAADSPTSSTGDERWRAVLAAGHKQADQIPIDLNLHTYADKYRALDQLATAYIVRTFIALGVFTSVGSTLRASDLVASFSVQPMYRLLMIRWLQKLAREGLLVESGDLFTAAQPLRAAEPQSLETAVEPLFADAPMLLEYVKNCGRQLTSILVGQTNALDTLFPGGTLELAEAIYHRAALSRYFNAIAGAVASAFARQHRGMLRVLEVGAGTGGTTASILPLLPAERTEYTITDVSDFFLGRAAERFQPLNGLKLGLLDLERAPDSQGYRAGQYDMVVAANVLHATKDLGQTLDFVHQLLSPDGLLVLYEVTDPPSYFDVSIALIEGWQKFSDSIRDTSPLLSTSQWKQCLMQHGFHETMSWPAAATTAEVLGSHVFVARAAGRSNVLPQQAGPSVALKSAQAYVTESAPDILVSLSDAPGGEQGEMMIGYVRDQVARVLRRPNHARFVDGH
jgi:SAM-dependent methyltransferase